MIFGIQYALIQAGFSALSYWLGNYIVHYTSATSAQLGLFFVIHPITYVCKPLVCALADRHHAHKLIYFWCLFGLPIAYIPYVILPYYHDRSYHQDEADAYASGQVKFWALTLVHAFGATCFNSVRALADALTMNYARRVNTDYGRYRRFGVMTFGTVGFLVGFFNTNWILPDYVLGLLILIGCFTVLTLLVFIWPDQYFEMLSESQIRDQQYIRDHHLELPGHCEALKLAAKKLAACCCCHLDGQKENFKDQTDCLDDKMVKTTAGQHHHHHHQLSVKKQTKIFLFLVLEDKRILMYLLLMVLCGLTGFSGQHFVQLDLKQTCNPERPSTLANNHHHCNSSPISGGIIGGICIFELITLAVQKHLHFGCMAKVQLAMLISALQYFGLYFLAHHSPYFYLIGSLHGAEAFIILLFCVEDGRRFANEVELHLVELRAKEIIDEQDDLNLVKVSLSATMIAILVLCFEGLGASLGRLALGFLIGQYGFQFAWLLLAILASSLLVILLIGVQLGRSMKLEDSPAIKKSASMA